jgi:hypothetical protein
MPIGLIKLQGRRAAIGGVAGLPHALRRGGK